MECSLLEVSSLFQYLPLCLLITFRPIIKFGSRVSQSFPEDRSAVAMVCQPVKIQRSFKTLWQQLLIKVPIKRRSCHQKQNILTISIFIVIVHYKDERDIKNEILKILVLISVTLCSSHNRVVINYLIEAILFLHQKFIWKLQCNKQLLKS